MRKVPIIALNAFMELIRQPVFLLLFTLAPLLCVALALPSYFGFGGTTTGPVNADLETTKDGALMVAFLSGLAAAVLCATASISREIETGTALAVLSKPVGRVHFLFGKYLGIVAALTVGAYLNLIGVLLASRMSHDAYTQYDIVGTITLLIVVALAYLAGGLVNYFLQKPFVPNTVLYLVVAMTAGFLIICAQDKTAAYYFIDDSAGIKASFWEIWKWTDTQGYYPPREAGADPEILPKLPEDKNLWQDVDFGLVPLNVLILFALWTIGAVAVACSTRLKWMPTMIICIGVFMAGMMSDYLLGKASEGGGAISPGEYLSYEPPPRKGGVVDAFIIEPRGIKRLDKLEYQVRISTGRKHEGAHLRREKGMVKSRWVAAESEAPLTEGIMLDAGAIENINISGGAGQRKESVQLEHEELRLLMRRELKDRWNQPLNQAIISVAREIMPSEFPAEDWETAAFVRSEEFLAEKDKKIAGWKQQAEQAGEDYSQREGKLTANLIDIIRREKEEEMVQEIYLKLDQNEVELRLGEYELDPSGKSDDDIEEFKEQQKARYEHLQYLRGQAQMDTLPGHLSFWVRPQEGTVRKLNRRTGQDEPISRGSSAAKFLYVLLPNWQLFWLSDAVSPEEEELKVLRQDMEFKKGTVSWSYVLTSLFYVLFYVGLMLCGAFWLFEKRELS